MQRRKVLKFQNNVPTDLPPPLIFGLENLAVCVVLRAHQMPVITALQDMIYMRSHGVAAERLLDEALTVMLEKMWCESGRANSSKVCFGVNGSTAARRMVQKKPSLAVTCGLQKRAEGPCRSQNGP